MLVSCPATQATSATPGRGEGGGDGRHLHGLDLVRCFAAVGVGVFHLTWRYPPLAAVPPIGWVGVQIFFVLSGFVIAASTRRATPMAFAGKRFLRIYPAAWACALIGIAVLTGLPGGAAVVGVDDAFGPQQIASTLALFGNTFVVSAYWTLPIELAFYALVAAAMLVGREPLAWLARGLVLWSGLYLAVYGLWVLELLPVPWIELGYGKRNMLLLRHGHYFALGILLWLAVGGAPRLRGWMAAAVALGVAEIACRAGEIVAKAGSGHTVAAVFTGAVLTWIAFCAAMVWSIRCDDRLPLGPVARRWLRTLGLMSYPFYLLHESVGGSVMGWLVLHGCPPVPALAAGLSATAAASGLVASTIEPALRGLLREGARRLPALVRAGGRARLARDGSAP